MRRNLGGICGLAVASCVLAQVPPTGMALREGAIRAHMAFLSDDLLEGRGTGQRGGELAVAYLESQLMALGLKPVGGAFRQEIPLVGARALADASSLRFTGPAGTVSFACGPEIIFNTTTGRETLDFDAPLVWVGYGIHAPEEGWDDFQGVDVRGRLLVLLAGEPGPTTAAPTHFQGAAMTYHGRWTSKFEEAQKRGAVGALIIHRTSGAAYGWEVVQAGGEGERFHLRDEPGGGSPFQGWITEPNGRDLLATLGQDLTRLTTRAEAAPAPPLELGMRLKGRLVSRVRPVTTWNVVAQVPGTDPLLREEAVVYSAHWDHLGRAADGRIFNGAVDNASGCAALLELARAAQAHPSRRTQLFVFFAAEEHLMGGSRAYVAQPLWPLARTVAVLNLDCMNFAGPTRDLGLQGAEDGPLAPIARRAAEGLGLKVRQEPPDVLGLRFRADHWSFARVGVPAFTPTMVLGAGPGWAFDHDAEARRAQAFGREAYHSPKDRYDPAWNLQGLLDQARFTLRLGEDLANAPNRPGVK